MNFGVIGSNYFVNSTPGPITPVTGIVATSGSPAVTFTGFPSTSATFGFLNPSANFQGFIDALRTEGLLKIHATPMVVTHNGQPAQILNGGEAPVLVPAGLGTTAIEFKPFGIIMDAVPHILGNGRLRLQIEPQVVERDFANSITVDGITVPSFTVRKVSTQVEMNFGETLMIGGLVNKREDGGTAKLPFLGELPWIGSAFSRKSYTEAETELIILVTPEYVAPMSPDEVPAGGPGKFTDTPTDSELFGLGLLEVPRVGPDCDATFNCMECNQNGGSCRRHPNGGRFGQGLGAMFGGGGGAGATGGPGCTNCTTEGSGTMLIQPEGTANSLEGPSTETEMTLPSASSVPTASDVPAQPVSSSADGPRTWQAVADEDGKDVKVIKSPTPRPGLISPGLFR